MNTTAAPAILDHLSALGDESRVRILLLLEGGEFTVSELCSALQLPQPTVSRHLRTLADDGWVAYRTAGRNRHYRLGEAVEGPLRDLWRVVRDGMAGSPLIGADAERARAVRSERRRRSAEFFAGAAGSWDHLRRDLFGAGAEFLPLLGLLQRDSRVGDLGTGTGGLAHLLAPFVREVVAVDRSPAMLEAAARRLQGLENVTLLPGDLEDLPLEDASLDLAVMSLVLHYLPDPPDALGEVYRVLRPGGRLLVLDLREHERGAEFAEEMGHIWPGFSPQLLEGWMEAAGFRDVNVVPVPPDAEARGPLLFLAAGVRPHPGGHEEDPAPTP
ncbi:MAG: ArsR/SmtB family transcription factor [Gemmatimonadota bacterium]